MIYFPRSIKPLTNRVYSSSRGANVRQTPSMGGVPRIDLLNDLECPEFNLSFSVSDNGFAAFLNFYDVAINHGADNFLMDIDSGNGVEAHECVIVKGSLNTVRPVDNVWNISLNVYALTTTTQV